MLPLQLAGIALAGRTVLSKYNNEYPFASKGKRTYKLAGNTKRMVFKAPDISIPFKTLFRGLSSTMEGLSSTVTQIKKRIVGEDYKAIVRSFIPTGAELLTPQFPSDAKEFQLVDLDGDTYNELIASYRYDNEIRTLILKKQDENWTKLTEISNPDYEILNFRGTSDITGEGREHLLIGLHSKGSLPVLYGYSVKDGNANEVFNQSYNKFEVLNRSNDKRTPSKVQLAVWNKNASDSYDISLLEWNGSQLEPINNSTDYFLKNVVPFYAKKLKRNPYSPSGWYALADSLVRVGARYDASAAINVGMRLDTKSEFKDDFLKLRNEIAGN